MGRWSKPSHTWTPGSFPGAVYPAYTVTTPAVWQAYPVTPMLAPSYSPSPWFAPVPFQVPVQTPMMVPTPIPVPTPVAVPSPIVPSPIVPSPVIRSSPNAYARHHQYISSPSRRPRPRSPPPEPQPVEPTSARHHCRHCHCDCDEHDEYRPESPDWVHSSALFPQQPSPQQLNIVLSLGSPHLSSMQSPEAPTIQIQPPSNPRSNEIPPSDHSQSPAAGSATFVVPTPRMAGRSAIIATIPLPY
ncbi:hypothetical protein BC834DRAFT_515484 [Gloeopeniophorella convolvens]|nr:hypothetical protein BC834DRAFT_515484 [Gloeopeniophorella convolvens]